MTAENFEEAMATAYDRFIDAFHPATLDRDTQITLGPEPFEWPDEVSAAHFQVFEVGSEWDTQAPAGQRQVRRSCVAMAEFRVKVDEGDATMNALVQLFRDTFEGVDVDGLLFIPACQVSPPGQEGRWQTKTCRANFEFYETK